MAEDTVTGYKRVLKSQKCNPLMRHDFRFELPFQ